MSGGRLTKRRTTMWRHGFKSSTRVLSLPVTADLVSYSVSTDGAFLWDKAVGTWNWSLRIPHTGLLLL